MKKFSEFGIKLSSKSFIGDKIRMDKILNIPIIVFDFKIDASKFEDKGNGKKLCLQIEKLGIKHIIFTGSVKLQEMIVQVPSISFPFEATIIKETKKKCQ